jgi:ribonuclease HIII
VFTGSWIGTDEAGKGDYFGPLVSAAVYVDDSIASHLQHLGVRDSKKLSDRKVRELAAAIRNQVGTRVLRVVPLVPSAYNRVQAQFVKEGKTLTTLLAWAHARAIGDLLKRDADTENAVVYPHDRPV